MANAATHDDAPRGRQARPITRRQFLKAGAMAGAVGTGLSVAQGRLLEAALAGGSGGGIEHIVILMQENRSFDHYFGTMPGVRGFNDSTLSYQSFSGGPTAIPASVFHQSMSGASTVTHTKSASYALANGPNPTELWPFDLVSTWPTSGGRTTSPPTAPGQTTNDITHNWGPQHGAWNNGAMDHFAIEHLINDPPAKWQVGSTDGIPVPGASRVPTGITTMGFYRSGDRLDFYRALAAAFTICDGYFCSVLGPTDPNRLFSMSGSLGAHSGDTGGPILNTYVQNRGQLYGTLDWPTMPELLTDADVTWKIYQDPTSNLLFNILPYFKNYTKPTNATQAQNAANALTPVYPAEFAADVSAGSLPQVSWILPPASSCEHPAAPPENGEWLVSQILQTLVSNQAVWANTVFLVIYDENGGFFDHVSPPTPGPTVQALPVPTTAPNGLSVDGEYLTVSNPANAAGGPPSDWASVLGPVGLGFRTPALVICPFSRGGYVDHNTFDHVSVLKLIETVFLKPAGATLTGGTNATDGLHVSPWRYSLVGDLTAALPLLPPATPEYDVPTNLPDTSGLLGFPWVFPARRRGSRAAAG